MGKYRLLTQANLPYARLQLIDDILSKIHFSPDHLPPGGSPRRLVKLDEKINPALKLAWERQTLKVQPNAWKNIPTWVHKSDMQFPALTPRPSQANSIEDKSVTTNTTLHLDNEEVLQMREQIDEMKKEISKLSLSYQKLLTSTTKNAISEAISKLPDNVRTLNAKVKKLDTITKQQTADLATLQEKQSDLDTTYTLQQSSITELSQQVQHLDSRQSAQDNNINALSGQISNVQSELKSSVTSIKTDMENQFEQVSSQLSQILSEILSQFQQFKLLFMQNNQEAVPFPECHTDSNSTGISTLTPLESKDKQGKRKLNPLEQQPMITHSPDQSSATQEESQMETCDDDDPDIQEL